MKIKGLVICLLAVCLAFAACKKNTTAEATTEGTGDNMSIKAGSNVSINYTLKVDGKVADTSEGKEPLSFVQGSGQIIPGLESELAGLKKGDKKHVTVSPENGYGVKEENAIQKVPLAAFKGMKDMKVGDIVTGRTENQEVNARIAAIGKDDVTLDFNHPLAGKTLEFDIEIVSVQ